MWIFTVFYLKIVSTQVVLQGGVFLERSDFNSTNASLLTISTQSCWCGPADRYDFESFEMKPSLGHHNHSFNTLRPRQIAAISQTILSNAFLLNENFRISIKILLKCVPKGPINNIPALVQIMAWRRPGDKPLSEPMMASLQTHICVTRPQWVKALTNQSPVFLKPLISIAYFQKD